MLWKNNDGKYIFDSREFWISFSQDASYAKPYSTFIAAMWGEFMWIWKWFQDNLVWLVNNTPE